MDISALSLRNRKMRPSDFIRDYIDQDGWPAPAPAMAQKGVAS